MTDSQWSTFLFLNSAQMGILLAIFIELMMLIWRNHK